MLDRFRSDKRSQRQRAIRWCPAAIVIATAMFLVVAVRPSAADDWQLMASDRGVDVYRHTVPGTGLVAFKGVGTIDAPLWKIASILLDTKRAPEWADSLKESHVVRHLTPSGYVEYNRLAMPFIVRDREFVSDVTIEVSPATRTFALVYRPTTERVPTSSHVVRGEILAGRFEAVSVEPGRRTRLTAELQADPKGLLPIWLVNMFQRSWPITTFEHLRAQANKADIVMPAEFADVLAPTRGF